MSSPPPSAAPLLSPSLPPPILLFLLLPSYAAVRGFGRRGQQGTAGDSRGQVRAEWGHHGGCEPYSTAPSGGVSQKTGALPSGPAAAQQEEELCLAPVRELAWSQNVSYRTISQISPKYMWERDEQSTSVGLSVYLLVCLSVSLSNTFKILYY